MMAYQNILFPNPKLIHGLQKEIVKQTKIITNGNTEYRISKMANFRQRWTWSSRVMLQSDINAILAFAETVDMAKDSFNFYCPIKKQTFKVRFEDASISFSVEGMDVNNNCIVGNLGDFTLIEVFE